MFSKEQIEHFYTKVKNFNKSSSFNTNDDKQKSKLEKVEKNNELVTDEEVDKEVNNFKSLNISKKTNLHGQKGKDQYYVLKNKLLLSKGKVGRSNKDIVDITNQSSHYSDPEVESLNKRNKLILLEAKNRNKKQKEKLKVDY